MDSIYFKKFLNLLNFIAARIILIFILAEKNRKQPNSVLITRLDSTGDYILFRNYLKSIKESKKFNNCSLTLCGNSLWRDLAVTLDSEVVDDFIWIDRKRFYNNPFYKYQILKDVYSRGFMTAIDATYTREVIYSDIVIKASKAEHKIGSKGSPDKHAAWKRIFFSNSFYDQLIDQTDDNLFEFERNKEFFEKLTGEEIFIPKPFIDINGLKSGQDLPDSFVVIFPGAANEIRRWNVRNYLIISEYIIETYKIPVVFTGSSNEAWISREIIKSNKSDMIIDLISKTSLVQLTKIISDSRLLISNDTVAVHIAASVDKPFLCISNGNHFGRFIPYPENIYNKCEYLFPSEIMDNLNQPEKLKEKYRFDSTLDINNISVEQVKDKVNLMIKKY